MRMIFRFSTLACFILLSTHLFAQKKTLPGYYITLQGDTVKGMFTNYRQWNYNPGEVTFAPDGTSAPVLLTPGMCRKLVIENNDEYISYTGKRLLNPIEDAVVANYGYNTSKDDEPQDIVIFLRLVTRVPGCDLYGLNDNNRINFFYQLAGHEVVELKYKKLYEQGHIIENAFYKQQLSNLFQKAIEQKKLSGKLENLNYTESGLTAFLQSLFPAKGERHQNGNSASGWYIFAGVSLNTINVVGDKSFSSVGKDFGTSVSPLLSVSYYLPDNRRFGKLFFMPQVKFFRYKNTSAWNDGTFIRHFTYKADLVVTAEANEGVNLINRESLRFYIAAGVGGSVQFNGKELNNAYRGSSGSLYAIGEQSLTALSYTISGSAGLILKDRIMISASYQVPSGSSTFMGYIPKLGGIQLKAGFRFSRKKRS